MYVHCDISSYGFVGDTETPLLRVYNVSGQYGGMQRVSFTQLNTCLLHTDSLILLKSI